MKIEGSVALVTGANRGLGKAYVDALLEAGVEKVYAAARQLLETGDPRVTHLKLDITSSADIAAAVRLCGDVNLLINNAGIMLNTTMLAANSADAMRREMDVNVFGTLAMIQAFAPILASNGGGAIANMLSVVSWFTFPFNATYCASKHAALAVSDAARIQLRSQGTQVVSVYAGFIDTDMASELAAADEPKTPPRQVAERTLQGILDGVDHVRADDRSENVWNLIRRDPGGFEKTMQQAWDARQSS